MKSALFVDFDNVYTGLRKMDSAVADRFARQPIEWINWLASSLALPDHSREGARRRLLVRRCYLNPVLYQKFRPSFNRAGFEIVDCPPMTSEGKTSTDIHMVLDIVDLLQHEAHYDEFVVFSADADFTPVLRKLRRWDRRTTVLAIGFPSAAYQASADLLVEPDAFVREALGFEDEDEPSVLPVAPSIPVLAKQVTQATATEKPAQKPATDALASSITQFIRQVVAESPRAVALTWIAQQLPERLPELKGSKWAGAGSFRTLIDSLSLTPLAIGWEGGGHVWDPRRHTTPLRDAAGPGTNGWGQDKALAAVARQIHDATGMPLLTPGEYGALFKAIAIDVTEQPFQLSETSKRVRDRCRAAGEAISRADVNFVLQGLVFSGHEFGGGNDTPAVLARRSAENALGLCRREQLQVDDAMTTMLVRWVAGGSAQVN
jgi:hypothetical protein